MLHSVKSGTSTSLRTAMGWAIGTSLVLAAGIFVISGQVHRGAETDAQTDRAFARDRAGIAARGGYLVMQAGAMVYHLPAFGGACASGRDRKHYSLNLDLPDLTISREPCEAPHVRADRALVHLSEHGPAFQPQPGRKPGWSPPALAAGEQHFKGCTPAQAAADRTNRCHRLDGMSRGGLRYSGRCMPLTFCFLSAEVAGLDADIYLYPSARASLGPLLDRPAEIIHASQISAG